MTLFARLLLTGLLAEYLARHASNTARAVLDDPNLDFVVISNTGVTAKEYSEYLSIAGTKSAAVSILQCQF